MTTATNGHRRIMAGTNPEGERQAAFNKWAGAASGMSPGLGLQSAPAFDYFSNVPARMGYGTPNLAEAATYELERLSYNYWLLITLYRNHWISRRIVDTPAQDMVRAWPKLTSDMSPEDLSRIDKALRRTQTKTRLLKSIKWARLFGGSGALIVIDGQENQLDKPLDLDSIGIGDYKGLIPFDRWAGIYPHGNVCTDINRPLDFNLPESYQVSSPSLDAFQVHASRVLRFTGPDVPTPEYEAQSWWGISVIEPAYEDIKKRDNMSWNILSLTFRACILGMKFPELAKMLSGLNIDQRAAFGFQQRMTDLNHLISNQSLVPLPENGSIEAVNYTFGGLGEVYQQFQLDISGATQIPVTRLWGRTISGLGQSNDADERIYEEKIATDQDVDLRPQLEKLFPVICASELGAVPDDLDLNFPSVRVLDEKEKADLAKTVTDTVVVAFNSGLTSPRTAAKELQQSSKATDIFTNITDESISALSDEVQQPGEQPGAGGEDPLAALAGGEGEEAQGGEGGEQTPPQPPAGGGGGKREKTPQEMIQKSFGPQKAVRSAISSVSSGSGSSTDRAEDNDRLDRLLRASYDGRFARGAARATDTTKREEIKRRLLVRTAYRIEPKTFEQFKRSALESMDEFPPDWQEELDRIEAKPNGLTRMLQEVWRDYTGTRLTDRTTDKAKFKEDLIKRDKEGKFAEKPGGAESGGGEEGEEDEGEEGGGRKVEEWKTGHLKSYASREEWPEYAQHLKIPPAWTNVRISPDANEDLLAVGRDSKGRGQYIYSEKFKNSQSALKWTRVQDLQSEMPKIDKQLNELRKSVDPKIKDHADVMMLIRKMGIRPGSESETKAKVKAYGATTLEGHHVWLIGGQVRLRFVGKKGVTISLPVKDPDLASMLRERRTTYGEKGQLFPRASDATLRAFVKDDLDHGGFHTKDFRTNVATEISTAAVAKMKAPTNPKEYKKAVKEVATQVSEQLGNTPAVALSSYIPPQVFAAWRSAADA